MDLYLPIAGVSVNALVIVGLGGLVGFLSGMFGVGGGFLTTPLLIFYGIPPVVAVASSATQITGASVSGLMAYVRRDAVDFRMGGMDTVNGEQAQIIAFRVPGTASLAPAEYLWWVGVDSGRLLKAAMVSVAHYMQETFGNFDGQVVITPPFDTQGTPVATPGFVPTAIPG